jgi:hypothetical protein
MRANRAGEEGGLHGHRGRRGKESERRGRGDPAAAVVHLNLALRQLNDACRDWASRMECNVVAREADRVHQALLGEPMDCAAILGGLRRVAHRVVHMADQVPDNLQTITTSADLLRTLLEWLEEVCAVLGYRIKGQPPTAS